LERYKHVYSSVSCKQITVKVEGNRTH
jgi:hypothetical protein